MRIILTRRANPLPADVLSVLGLAQRRLRQEVELQVLAGSGLTLEIAELLIELFLPDHLDAGGYISFSELKDSLGYSSALFSRRITYLCERHWVETKRAAADLALGIHGNSQKVKITERGRVTIGPIWKKYNLFAGQMLDGLSQQDRETTYRALLLVCDKIHPPAVMLEPLPERIPEFLD